VLVTRIDRKKRRRWLKFWAKYWKPLPAFHTLRTIERLEGDTYRMNLFASGEVGMIENVTWIELNKP